MLYADYEYYSGTYGGSAIAEADFFRLSRQASAYLDELTLGKITGEWESNEKVKDACCAVMEVIAKHDEHSEGGIASESNDGGSVSFVTSSAEERRKEMRRAATMFLSNTGLLYAGVD